MTEVHETNNDI